MTFKRPTRFILKVPEIEAIFLNTCWNYDGIHKGVRVSVPDPAGGKYKLWITLPMEWVEEVSK